MCEGTGRNDARAFSLGLRENGGSAPQGGGEIVPVADGARPRGHLPVTAALVGCVVGGVASAAFPLASCGLVAACHLVVRREASAKARVLAAPLALGPAVLVCLLFRAPLPEALVACVVGLVASVFAAGRGLTTGRGIVLAVLASCALLASDAALALLLGTTLQSRMEELASDWLSSLAPGAGMAQADEVRQMFSVLWPQSYVAVGTVMVLLAIAGIWVGSRRSGLPRELLPRLSGFDLPLWVVGAVAAALLGLTVGRIGSIGSVSMVSANVAACGRVALAVQGYAALAYVIASRHRIGPVGASALAVASVLLESQFYALTIVGLVDVWRNLRQLPRGASTKAGGSQQE